MIEKENLPDNQEWKANQENQEFEDARERGIDETIRRDEIEIIALEEVLEEKREEVHHLKEEKETHHHHPQVIDVNTREKEYLKTEISFREVVLIAYPDAIFNDRFTYTVEYNKGPVENPKGSLTDNNKVYVKNKMVFDVERGDVS